jgi:hypothetical protein
MVDFHAKVFPRIPRNKKIYPSKTDYTLIKKDNSRKKMKATLTCLTIGYNLAVLPNPINGGLSIKPSNLESSGIKTS